MGRSAGATLAVLLAVTGGVDEFEGDRGHPRFSSHIQAAVGMAGVYDFVARFSDPDQTALQPRLDTKRNTNGQWIGVPFAPTSAEWRNASAINHVDAADPPILLMHCQDDETVPWIQSREMDARLREVMVESEIEIYETGGHGVHPPSPHDSQARMVSFFRKALAPSPIAADGEDGAGDQ